MGNRNILPFFFCVLLLSTAPGGMLDSFIVTGTDTRFPEKPIIAEPNTILVPDDHRKIQWAIENATDADTIFVKGGIYFEQLFVDKPLTIVGEDKNTTIIVGRVTVFSNHVVIRSLTIRNAPSLYCGITIYSNSNVISENIIKNNGEDGVWLSYNTKGNTITGNIIEGNIFCGISLDNSTDNIISKNSITNHQHGMLMTNSENNTIIENTFTANAHCGCHLDSSNNNVIYHNNFINSPVHSHDSTNIWDNGAKGNYWSDHICTGNPNDGSQPYVIDTNNIDHHPFQDPNGWLLTLAITVLSPENKTYSTSSVPLASTVSELASWIGYSLDNQANVTITGNTTLTELSDGMHNLVVYASDIAGNIGSSSIVYFTIDSISPRADAGPDQIVNKTTLVTFDGIHSSDNVGITNYRWSFVDKAPTTLTGVNPTYTFNIPGNYTVTLKVTDAAGNYDIDTVTIRVLDVPEAFPWWIIGLTVVAVGGVVLLIAVYWKRKTRENHKQARARSRKR